MPPAPPVPPPELTHTSSVAPVTPDTVPPTVSPVPPGMVNLPLMRLWPALPVAVMETVATPAGTGHVEQPAVVNDVVVADAAVGAKAAPVVTAAMPRVSSENRPVQRPT